MSFLERWQRRLETRAIEWAERERDLLYSSNPGLLKIEGSEASRFLTTFSMAEMVREKVISETARERAVNPIQAAWWETDPSRPLEKLNPQDRQLLDFLVKGASDEEIAAKLEVDVRTVRENIRILLGLLNVRSRLAATALVYPRGFFLYPKAMRALWDLSPRQKTVLHLLINVAEDQEIARSLGITPESAQQEVEGLLMALKVDSRRAAVALALQNRFQYWYSPKH